MRVLPNPIPNSPRLAGWLTDGTACPLGNVHIAPVYISGAGIVWESVTVAGTNAETPTQVCPCSRAD